MAGDVQVTFAYDYLSRRVAKRVYVYDPNASPAWLLTKDRRFIWDGWLMLREIEGGVGVPPASPTTVATYLWGLDLAGQMGSVGVSPASGGGVGFLTQAGGIGGLIAVNIAQPEPNTPGGTFIYCYDGNGNVTQLVRPTTGALGVKYDYDPYGTRINAADPNELSQPWRFSTKQLDAETGLQYFGYRYRAERWISRDPLGEIGGLSLYNFNSSDPLNRRDPFGLVDCERVYVVAGKAGAAARRRLADDWHLQRVIIGGLDEATGSGFEKVYRASAFNAIWARPYVELFKCCVKNAVSFHWGEVFYEQIAKSGNCPESDPPLVRRLAADLGYKNVTVLSIPLTGLTPIDESNAAIILKWVQLTRPSVNDVGAFEQPKPPNFPDGKGGTEAARIVPHIPCDSAGTAGPWPQVTEPPTPAWKPDPKWPLY